MSDAGALSNRLGLAGVDVDAVSRSSVLIKIDEMAETDILKHPVEPLCRALGAAGFGPVQIQGAVDYHETLDQVLREYSFTQIPGAWTDGRIPHDIPITDVVVDLTNDRQSKSLCAELCRISSGTIVSAVCGRGWVAVASARGHKVDPNCLHTAYADDVPLTAPVSRISAGIVLQEILAAVARVPLMVPAESETLFNAATQNRTGRRCPWPWPVPPIEGVTVDVIGAGAIGVNVLECLVPLLGSGSEVRIFDPDHVGPENLPLQMAYRSGHIGESKAAAISRKLEASCEVGVHFHPYPIRYEERPAHLRCPSVRIACPDNFAARKCANDASIQDGAPLVEAGSSPFAAQQRSYYSGQSACLDCRIPDLAEKAASEQGRTSCSDIRALTLPGTNMVIAGILATEALRALRPRMFGLPSCGTITYDARVPERFGILDVLPACCHGTRATTAASST